MVELEVIAGDDEGLIAALTSAGLPVDDLAEGGRTFFCFSVDGQAIGYGGYELLGQDAFIRSLAVLQTRQGQGLGKMATAALMRQTTHSGARRAYLLTTSAKGFFQRLGFQEIERSAAPASILATRQASSLCPSSAVLMMRDLQE